MVISNFGLFITLFTQLLENHIKKEIIEKSQLVHATTNFDEKVPISEPRLSASVACGAKVFEVTMKVPLWTSQVALYVPAVCELMPYHLIYVFLEKHLLVFGEKNLVVSLSMLCEAHVTVVSPGFEAISPRCISPWVGCSWCC